MTATRDRECRQLARRFKEAGLANAELDARLLMRAVCGGDEIEMIREPGRRLDADEVARLRDFEARRLGREPVARILGRREFWGLPFWLSPATLDPRPDSETLVEAALDCLRDVAAPSILDLGTGTGCLLLAILHERKDAHGLGVDLAEEAVATARRNAATLDLAARASFRRANWADGIEERFDLVVSNPPYIPAADIATLEPEVRTFDPRLALDGGEDGLDAYRALAAVLPRLLAPRGKAIVELGAGQAEAVRAMFADAGLEVERVVSDLGRVPRALVAAAPRRRSGGIAP